jgi:glycosyltransferase involved in cell wall biosynthesis
VSVVLPVIDETESLRKTVDVVLRDCDADVREFLIVVCTRTTPQSLAVCEELKARLGPRVNLIRQRLPYLGGACRDAFDAARGSTHVLLMASDCETPPERVRAFLDEGRRRPEAIITGSRWLRGGGFAGYSRLKYLLNFLFQRSFSLLYRTRLGDMTYGYRLFPRRLVQAIRWEELRHAFLFETLVKPLRLGVPVVEIPAEWKARAEGRSQNTFLQNFVYFRIGLKTLFYTRRRILKPQAERGAPPP